MQRNEWMQYVVEGIRYLFPVILLIIRLLDHVTFYCTQLFGPSCKPEHCFKMFLWCLVLRKTNSGMFPIKKTTMNKLNAGRVRANESALEQYSLPRASEKQSHDRFTNSPFRFRLWNILNVHFRLSFCLLVLKLCVTDCFKINVSSQFCRLVVPVLIQKSMCSLSMMSGQSPMSQS